MTPAGRRADVIRDSAVYRGADWMLTQVSTAWAASSTARVWSTVRLSDRTKFWSIAVIAAALTVLSASPFGTTPSPLAWLVPAAAAAVAMLVLVMSSGRSGSQSV